MKRRLLALYAPSLTLALSLQTASAQEAEPTTPVASDPDVRGGQTAGNPGSDTPAGPAAGTTRARDAGGTGGAEEKSAAELAKDQFAPLMSRPGGLTSDEAARKASAYTREALVAQGDYAYAKAKKDETIYAYLPRLTLTAQYQRLYVPQSGLGFGDANLVGTAGDPNTPGNLFPIDTAAFNFSPLPNSWYLNANLVVPISDYVLNFSQALQGAEAATKSAEMNEKAARLDAAANARVAYYDWTRARLRLAEVESAIRRAEAQYRNLQALEQGGRASRADVLQQDAFLANAELDLRRAATNEASARERLYVLMNGGSGETPDWEIGEDILRDLPEDEGNLESTMELHREAMATRLEIRALDETVYALEQREFVEKTEGYPRVEAFGNLTYANPNQVVVPPTNEWNGSWDVGIRAVWTLNNLGARYSAAKATSAEQAKVEAQKQQLLDGLRTEVLTARRSILEARLARESARRGVEAARAAYLDRRVLFDNGRGTNLDVLQAETALVNARMGLIDAYIALRQAHVRLEHAVGRDVPDELREND